MVDKLTKAQRSYVMSRIKSNNTKPELAFRMHLRGMGIKNYTTHAKITGTPDVVIASSKIALFVDGCFWHGCPTCYKAPQSNRNFWRKKVERNINRDKETARLLRASGWKVARFWEHQLIGDMSSVDRKLLEIGVAK